MTEEHAVELVEQPVETPERRHILIVDDEVSQTQILAYSFQKLGFKVTVVHSGPAGLEAARNEHPDLIVLDIEMPEMSGLEICHDLKDSSETCEIPIIFVSGTERPDVIRAARSAGSEFFLAKPYDPNALLTLVQAALGGECEW